MALTGSILRSRAVAALASPHGVDRYLEPALPDRARSSRDAAPVAEQAVAA